MLQQLSPVFHDLPYVRVNIIIILYIILMIGGRNKQRIKINHINPQILQIIHLFKTESDDSFDYYAHTVQLENQEISYYFEIQAGKIICYYNLSGVQKGVDRHYDFRLTGRIAEI